jgi:hypothetical protein
MCVALTAAVVCAADNSIGTWNRNIEKSKGTPPPVSPYKQQTTTREAVDGGFKSTSKGERANGTRTDNTYTAKYDGKPVRVTGTAPYDTIAWKQIDANTFTMETHKAGGKYHTTGKTTISKDGKTMISDQKGIGEDGKPTAFTIVYEKQ